MDGRGQVEDQEAGTQCCRPATPNSHRDRQTGTRKSDGKICGRGQKTKAISGDLARREGRGQSSESEDDPSSSGVSGGGH